MASSKLRIYRVNETLDNKETHTYLVRAPNKARAISFIAKRFTASNATQDDLVKLTSTGVKVQDATPDVE